MVVILLISSKGFLELLEYISDNSVNVLPWVSGNMNMAKMHNKIQIALWTQNTAGNPIIWTSDGNIFKLMKDTKYLEWSSRDRIIQENLCTYLTNLGTKVLNNYYLKFCHRFSILIISHYLNDMIMPVAIPLIFRGNISPKRANNTGDHTCWNFRKRLGDCLQW